MISRIIGGLGNQLFSYATARRLAIANNAELVLDDTSGFVRDYKYRRRYQLDRFNISARTATPSERLEPFSRARRYLKRNWNRFLPFERRRYIQQQGVDFDARLLRVSPRGTIYLEGYWQSELYFKDIEQTIRTDLVIAPPTDHANELASRKISALQSVAVHVRFFNAPHEQGGDNAPIEYYRRAIATMESMVPSAHYFLFSDQPGAARGILPLPDERLTVVAHNRGDENAYADLWLMTQCQHFIVANSTFSWWGAWLASHPGKHVIAPAFEIRQGEMSWGFDGLLPNEWIKL